MYAAFIKQTSETIAKYKTACESQISLTTELADTRAQIEAKGRTITLCNADLNVAVAKTEELKTKHEELTESQAELENICAQKAREVSNSNS